MNFIQIKLATFKDTEEAEGDSAEAAKLRQTITDVYEKFSTNLIMTAEWSHPLLQDLIKADYSVKCGSGSVAKYGLQCRNMHADDEVGWSFFVYLSISKIGQFVYLSICLFVF